MVFGWFTAFKLTVAFSTMPEMDTVAHQELSTPFYSMVSTSFARIVGAMDFVGAMYFVHTDISKREVDTVAILIGYNC